MGRPADPRPTETVRRRRRGRKRVEMEPHDVAAARRVSQRVRIEKRALDSTERAPHSPQSPTPAAVAAAARGGDAAVPGADAAVAVAAADPGVHAAPRPATTQEDELLLAMAESDLEDKVPIASPPFSPSPLRPPRSAANTCLCLGPLSPLPAERDPQDQQ